MGNSKINYTWDDYDRDIHNIAGILRTHDKKVHLVSLYRGSLGIATHLSNIIDAPLSIIKFQTRDGNDKSPYFIHNEGIDQDDTVVLLDDIYDTGHTLDVTEAFLKENGFNNILKIVLFTNNVVDGVHYANKTSGKWVVFYFIK